ncbi:MAG TPA: Hint domain-containing protein, partial [Archangium sp.]|nr:Hint domain-containing protein [Archangium sp.]
MAMFLFTFKSNAHEEQQAVYSHGDQGLRGRGERGRLSKDEWATHMADQRYLHGLARPNVRIRLNLADQRQYRFAMARLKLAGKTPGNSPYLFQAMEQRRQKHLARGFQAGLLPTPERGLQSTGGTSEMHFIETASIGESTAVANDGTGTASSTFPGGAFYTYADINYTDVSGYPLGDLGWVEEFDGGYSVTVSNTADLSQTSLTRYSVSSYKIEDSAEGFTDSYIFTEMGADNGAPVPEKPSMSIPLVQAPLDVKLNDGIISVCLNRTWTQDCDYDLTGSLHAVKLPLKGSLTIQSSHTFDEATINKIRTDLNNKQPVDDAGHIKLILTKGGGGCDVVDGNTLVASMSQFWNRVTLSTNKKTFYWDLTGTNAAFFDEGCRQVQDRVKLTARIFLPLISGGLKHSSSITLSNDDNVFRPVYKFKPITITNSCLAAGTEIELAAGGSTPIESLKVGDRASNPYRDSLTVMDTAIGIEPVPMVRIRDEAGRTLLMTEMHPIQVVTRGMVQARSLQEGDLV